MLPVQNCPIVFNLYRYKGYFVGGGWGYWGGKSQVSHSTVWNPGHSSSFSHTHWTISAASGSYQPAPPYLALSTQL